jgi:hypothetical protein
VAGLGLFAAVVAFQWLRRDRGQLRTFSR